MMGENQLREEDIAIIGLSGRFPKANKIDQFWKNLCDGQESIHYFNDEELMSAGINKLLYSKTNYVKAKGILDHVEYFDADFFGLSSLEAQLLDPQHRLFMLCAWEAFENAGYVPTKNHNRVGVFASSGLSFYLLNNIMSNPELLATIDEYQLLLSHDKDFLATRVSYLFNLQGPSINIQTGCSSSLACVHYACQSILNGECDLALAGGVSITIPQQQGYIYKKEMIGSPDGHCYTFDKRAQGTVKSNGLGIVLLKPLIEAVKDNDHIYAVIRGSAVNNDGASKVGYTAPGVSQQTAVIKEALSVAEVPINTIEYIETHGTGTILGDPIEISALKQAFNQKNIMQPFCGLASVKSNLGHLDIAAGVTSLIKASLSVYYGKIPATLNFNELNPQITLVGSPFYINTELKDWQPENYPRRAGVSAFGVGGTNVHFIVQQPPKRQAIQCEQSHHLLFFSAKSKISLNKNIESIQLFLQDNPQVELSDVAYTLQVGRQAMQYRVALVSENKAELCQQLQAINVDNVQATGDLPNVVFMFSGQGAQYPGMGLGLYQSEISFKQAFDRCLNAFKPYLSFDLKQFIFSNEDEMHDKLMQTEVTQPALFTIEYALAQCCMSYGIQPCAVVGHSIGEYVAAVLAGIFSLEDAARLVAKRGQLIQKLPHGGMLAVHADHQMISTILPSTLDIALENAPKLIVVSGASDEINLFMKDLERKKIRFQMLHTSHAFHSRMLEPILLEFEKEFLGIKLQSPQMLIASNVTGKWLTTEQACSSEYWVEQLRNTVKFADCIANIQQQFAPIFLEIGPGRTLQSLAYQQGIKKALNTLNHPQENSNEIVTFYRALGQLWTNGVNLKPVCKANKIPLPTYNWDLRRYWIDAHKPKEVAQHESELVADVLQNSNDMSDKVLQIWQKVLGSLPSSQEDNFFSLGGNSLTAIQLIDYLPDELKDKINVVHLYQYPKFNQFVSFLESIMQSNDNNISLQSEMNYEQELFSAEGRI